MNKRIIPTLRKSSHGEMEMEGLLDLLGDHFVKERLHDKGWKFEDFVQAFKDGYIQMEIK